MTVQSIKKLLNARVLGGEDMLDREVFTACGSDMMSDVLAHQTSILLLTKIGCCALRK